jgi:hypothetical protein
MLSLETSLKIGGLSSKATTQRSNYDFNSFFKFNGKYHGISPTKLALLEGDDYDGAEINSYLVVVSDLGYVGPKTIRSLFLGVETANNLTIEVSADEQTAQIISTNILKTGQQNIKVSVSRATRGRFLKIKISNVDGADYSLDFLHGLVNKLSKGRNDY